MTLSVEHLEEYTLIKITGRFDGEMNAATQKYFDELVHDIDRDIIIDFSLVTQIDTSGIGVILFFFKRLRIAGYRLELIGLHGRALKKLLKLELNKCIKISPL